jgi:hypothetical protein
MRARHRHFNPAHAGATIALDSRYGFSQADGTAVSTWEDRSNTNNDATQGTNSNRPTYETGEVGGQPAIRFDGSNDFLSYGTSVFGYTSGATVIAVVNATSAASEYGSVISEYSSARNSIGCQMSVFPNNAIEPCTDVFQPGGVRYNSTLTNSTWQIVGWSWSNWSTHKTNGDTRLAAGGAEASGATYGADPLGFTSTLRSIGRFDANAISGNHMQADIALVAKLPECGAALRKRLYHHAAYSFKLSCN